jgi:signal transduction histidine kinase
MHELTLVSFVLISAPGLVFGLVQWRKARSLNRQMVQLTTQMEETRAELSAAHEQLVAVRTSQSNEMNRVLHDIKSPLSAILCLTLLLRKTGTTFTSKDEQFLTLIEADVNKLFGMLSRASDRAETTTTAQEHQISEVAIKQAAESARAK